MTVSFPDDGSKQFHAQSGVVSCTELIGHNAQFDIAVPPHSNTPDSGPTCPEIQDQSVSGLGSDSYPRPAAKIPPFPWGRMVWALILLFGGTIGYFTAIRPLNRRLEYTNQLSRVGNLIIVFGELYHRGPADVDELECFHDLLKNTEFRRQTAAFTRMSDSTEPIDQVLNDIRQGTVTIVWNADWQWHLNSPYQYLGYESKISSESSLIIGRYGAVEIVEPNLFSTTYSPAVSRPPPDKSLLLRKKVPHKGPAQPGTK